MASPAKQQRVDEETAHEPSLAEYFSAEILNLIALALTADADVLIPRHIGSLARTCKCIKDAVQDANDKLREKHRAARALCNRCGTSVDHIMVDRPKALNWYQLEDQDLVPADAPALIDVLMSKAMAQVQRLQIFSSSLGVAGAAAIAAAAAGGGLPQLTVLNLHTSDIGDTGMQALASALAGGAFPELITLNLGGNEIGDAGVTALAAALEKGALPKLDELNLWSNEFGDEGLKALMAAAGGGRLAKLRYLREFDVDLNAFGEEAIGVLADAIEKDAMPSLEQLAVPSPHEFNPRLIAACEEKEITLI